MALLFWRCFRDRPVIAFDWGALFHVARDGMPPDADA